MRVFHYSWQKIRKANLLRREKLRETDTGHPQSAHPKDHNLTDYRTKEPASLDFYDLKHYLLLFKS